MEGDVAYGVVVVLRGEFRHQRNGAAGGYHVAQGFQAGGAEAVGLSYADQVAYLQRLFAQAVAFFQQQQRLMTQVFIGYGFSFSQRMRDRHGEQERLVEYWFCD